jgi:hypothetical protein
MKARRRIMIKRMFLFFTIILFLSLPFLSVETEVDIEKNIYAAVEQYKKGNETGVVDLLSDVIRVIQNKKEFKISEMQLASEINGYQDYEKLKGGVLGNDKQLLVYIELEGFKIIKEEGKNWIWITQDVEISDQSGKILFQKRDWISLKKSYPYAIFPAHLANRISNIKPGKYKYQVTIKDHYKKAFVTKTLEFTVNKGEETKPQEKQEQKPKTRDK